MKSKKVIAAVLTLAICVGSIPYTVFAQEPVTTEETTRVKTNMKIEDALAYALEHSLAVSALKTDVQKCEYLLKDATSTYNRYRDKNPEIYSFEEYLVRKGYAMHAAEYQLRVAQRAVITGEYDLNVQVKNDFYTYLTYKEKTQIAEGNVKNSKSNLTWAKEKRDKGVISDLDVMQFNMACIAAENALKQAVRDENYALLSLKNTMNYPTEQPLTIEDEFLNTTVEILDTAKANEKAKDNIMMLNLKENFDLVKERKNCAEQWYMSNTHQYKAEMFAYQSSEANFEKNQKEIQLQIQKMYDSILTIQDGIQLIEENLIVKKSLVDTLQVKYDMGMISAGELITEMQNYYDLMNQQKTLQLNEYMTKLQYQALYSYDN